MKQEKQQAIALMRYGAIAPLIAGLDEDYPSKTAFYMELSTKGLVGPDGRVHHYAPSTIEKWYLDYQNHGFDALIPKGRSDAGMSRYERPHINEVWCGDSSVGPHLTDADGKKHRIYIIALIDDASRFITGIDVFYNDNFINLMSVMKSAVSKYGRPKVLNFDNGKSYKNKQMELLAARIGTTLSYCQPYTPTSKAKIERWFRTLKDQWMAGLDMRDFRSLDELRGSLYAYVQSYNLAPHSSLRGMSPQDRFFSEPDHIRCLTQDNID